MSGCALWLLILIAANGGVLGLLLAYVRNARASLLAAEQARENAVREFARWRALADAHDAAQQRRREVLKGGS